jgi:hypothetical protein
VVESPFYNASSSIFTKQYWPKYALMEKLWPLHGNYIKFLKAIFMCQNVECTSGEKPKSHYKTCAIGKNKCPLIAIFLHHGKLSQIMESIVLNSTKLLVLCSGHVIIKVVASTLVNGFSMQETNFELNGLQTWLGGSLCTKLTCPRQWPCSWLYANGLKNLPVVQWKQPPSNALVSWPTLHMSSAW